MTRVGCGFVGALFLAVLLAGCGPTPVQTVRVVGRVTFAGGAPPAAGTLTFAPLEPAPGFTRHAAQARFNSRGDIEVTTFRPGDGLVPGRYEVKVACWRTPPSELSPGESLVPAGYRAPEFTVPEQARGPVELLLNVTAGP